MDLQGKQTDGRTKITDLLDFSDICAEVRGRAGHLDAVTLEWFCQKVDALRLQHAKIKDPDIQSVSPMDKRTYKKILDELDLRIIETPARKTTRRVIAGNDFLNALNWAAMVLAVLKRPVVPSTETASSFSAGLICADLILNIDSTSLLLQFDEACVPKVVVPLATERRLKELGISVSISSDALKSMTETQQLPCKTRSLQMHALTAASGKLLAVVFEIGDNSIAKFKLIKVSFSLYTSIFFHTCFLIYSQLSSDVSYKQWILFRPAKTYNRLMAAKLLLKYCIVPTIEEQRNMVMQQAAATNIESVTVVALQPEEEVALVDESLPKQMSKEIISG